VPFAFVHWLPQALQLSTLVIRFVSQPVARASPSQLPKPALQAMEQTLPEQEGKPPVVLQAAPQPPQWATVAVVFVSQPLFGFPSQSSKPELQTGEQAPSTQEVVPFAFVHVTPQAPQWLAALRDCSQPVASLPSQLSKPVSQLTTAQVPVAQDSVPFGRSQVSPQLPQSVRVRTLVSQPSVGSPLQLR
jgi:hypothetical protein